MNRAQHGRKGQRLEHFSHGDVVGMQNHAASQAEQGPYIHLPSNIHPRVHLQGEGTQVFLDVRDSQLSKTEPTEQSEAAQHGGHRHSFCG